MPKGKISKRDAADEIESEAADLGSDEVKIVVKYGRDGQLSREFSDKEAAAEFAKKREIVHGDKVSVE